MDAQPTGSRGSSHDHAAALAVGFFLQAGWLAAGVFFLSLAGEWFERMSGGLLSPASPAAGFAVAAALVYGLGRVIPAAYLGLLASNLFGGEPSLFLYAEPAGFLLEISVSWTLLTKVSRMDPGFSRLRDFGRFVALGCLPGPLLGACCLAVLLAISGPIPASLVLAGPAGFFLAHAFGLLVFGPFFLFVLRRQSFRPPTVGGRFELLGYVALLAGLLFFLVHDQALGLGVRLAAIVATIALSLLVALRFGLRTASMVQALSVFLVPAFAAIVPERLDDVRILAAGGELQPLVQAVAFLASLGCLFAAAFRDEWDSLRMKFALAMSSANLCVWDWSAAGWAYHTPAWREKFGVGPAKAISNEVVLGLVHPEDLPEFEGNFRRLCSAEIPNWSQNCRMRNSEGGWVCVQIDAKPLDRNADGEISSLAGVMRDTTYELEAVQNRIAAIETEAQLRTLRSQINPHFLFNALNSIRALIGRQDMKAKSMVTSLASLLREVLAGRDSRLQSVEKELEIVRDYLEIEAIRFGERLRYRIVCPPGLLAQKIPGMLVLTLVENSVKHGISKLEKGGALEVLIGRTPDNSSLIVFVVNDGALKRESRDAGGYGGQGLENVRERITLSTGKRGSFEIHEIPGPRVEAIALIPFDKRFLPDDSIPAA